MDIEGVPQNKQLVAEYVMASFRHHTAVKAGDWPAVAVALEQLIKAARALAKAGGLCLDALNELARQHRELMRPALRVVKDDDDGR